MWILVDKNEGTKEDKHVWQLVREKNVENSVDGEKNKQINMGANWKVVHIGKW